MLDKRMSCNYKKYQRDLNKIVRRINTSIKNDWLWNGRFTLSQYSMYFAPYEDHSGGEFAFVLRLRDNETGRVEHKWFNQYSASLWISRWVNEMIVNNWKVWDEVPDPNTKARLAGRTPD